MRLKITCHEASSGHGRNCIRRELLCVHFNCNADSFIYIYTRNYINLTKTVYRVFKMSSGFKIDPWGSVYPSPQSRILAHNAAVPRWAVGAVWFGLVLTQTWTHIELPLLRNNILKPLWLRREDRLNKRSVHLFSILLPLIHAIIFCLSQDFCCCFSPNGVWLIKPFYI